MKADGDVGPSAARAAGCEARSVVDNGSGFGDREDRQVADGGSAPVAARSLLVPRGRACGGERADR